MLKLLGRFYGAPEQTGDNYAGSFRSGADYAESYTTDYHPPNQYGGQQNASILHGLSSVGSGYSSEYRQYPDNIGSPSDRSDSPSDAINLPNSSSVNTARMTNSGRILEVRTNLHHFFYFFCCFFLSPLYIIFCKDLSYIVLSIIHAASPSKKPQIASNTKKLKKKSHQ